MKNEQNIWAKVVLSAYRYLERLCRTIDRLVETTAENSMYTNSYWQNECSITTIFKKINKLTEKKIDYINLKLIVEKALKSLPIKLSKILILRYIHQLPMEKVAELLKLTHRTTYRKLDFANEQMINAMSRLGYTPEYMNIKFADDSYISSLYNSILDYHRYSKNIGTDCSDEMLIKLLHDFELNPI